MGIFLNTNNEKRRANTTLKNKPPVAAKVATVVTWRRSNYYEACLSRRSIESCASEKCKPLPRQQWRWEVLASEVLLLPQEKHWGGMAFPAAQNGSKKTEGNLGCAQFRVCVFGSTQFEVIDVIALRRVWSYLLNIEAYNFKYTLQLDLMYPIMICILPQLLFYFFNLKKT